MQRRSKTYSKIREKFAKIVEEYDLKEEETIVKAKPLTSQEAIGHPEESDYPLIKRKERLMQAEFKNSFGQAFTDMYGDYKGKLTDIVKMELKNNLRRAIFISTLNAIMRYLKLVDKTVHCKNDEMRECSEKLALYIREKFGNPKIAMVGFQPRMVEALRGNFKVGVTDLDSDNIGKGKFGIQIEDADKTEENLKWCDVALVTGTTVINNSIKNFLTFDKPVIFYGVTIAGVAKLLDLNRFCPLGS